MGGDSGFVYTGNYTKNGNALNARVHVRRGSPGVLSVMGRDEFDLELNGTVQNDAVAAAGSIPGTGQRFQAKLTKQMNLPTAH